MSDRRILHQSFWSSKDMHSVPTPARLLFAYLFTKCDDWGRIEYRPYNFRNGAFAPNDPVAEADIVKWAQILEQQGCIALYTDHSSRQLVWVRNFSHYQPMRYRRQSSLAAHPDDDSGNLPQVAETSRKFLCRHGNLRKSAGTKSTKSTNSRSSSSTRNPPQAAGLSSGEDKPQRKKTPRWDEAEVRAIFAAWTALAEMDGYPPVPSQAVRIKAQVGATLKQLRGRDGAFPSAGIGTLIETFNEQVARVDDWHRQRMMKFTAIWCKPANAEALLTGQWRDGSPVQKPPKQTIPDVEKWSKEHGNKGDGDE